MKKDNMKIRVFNNIDIENEKQKIMKDNWEIAFGLQAVDNLRPSKYMLKLAKENLYEKKSLEEVKEELTDYYKNQRYINYSEKQADEVSLNTIKVLRDKAFSFEFVSLKQYHKRLFEGVEIGIDSKYIGNFRDYNITKSEPILNGETVQYADYSMIEETLKYDFEDESNQAYIKMTDSEKIDRIVKFTSNIWQVHPFGEGNTRTTAIFIQKYLISKGFDVNNDLFKDNSKFFRNALVKANYSNISKGIEENKTYLKMFFENLLLGKQNKLKI